VQGDGEESEISLENKAVPGFPDPDEAKLTLCGSPESLRKESLSKAAPTEVTSARMPKWKFWSNTEVKVLA
jgi:hypothetical protein